MNGKLMVLLALVAIGGCTSVPDRIAFQQHREVLPSTYAASGPSHTAQALPVLDENASLQDYLAYASMNNAGLRAAFNRWKAAIEKVAQVSSLPDPMLTYGYFIQEVETRAGPQEWRARPG